MSVCLLACQTSLTDKSAHTLPIDIQLNMRETHTMDLPCLFDVGVYCYYHVGCLYLPKQLLTRELGAHKTRTRLSIRSKRSAQMLRERYEYNFILSKE